MTRFAVLLALAASPVLAQSQTTCFVSGRWIDCSTRPSGGFNTAPTDFLSGMGGVANLPNPYAEQQAAQRAYQESQLRQQQIEAQRLANERAAEELARMRAAPPR
jgi:hypothetical protein